MLFRLIAAPPPPVRRIAVTTLVVVVATLCWALVTPGMGPGERFGADKIAHASAFALVGSLAAIAWPGRRAAVLSFLGLVLLGALTELAQMIVPYRSASLGDVAADVIGAAIGISAIFLIRRLQLGRIRLQDA